VSQKDRLLTRERIAASGGPVRIPTGARPDARPAPPTGGTAQVDLVRDDDGTVQAVVVRCPCGRVTTLECRYADSPARRPARPASTEEKRHA